MRRTDSVSKPFSIRNCLLTLCPFSIAVITDDVKMSDRCSSYSCLKIRIVIS